MLCKLWLMHKNMCFCHNYRNKIFLIAFFFNLFLIICIYVKVKPLFIWMRLYFTENFATSVLPFVTLSAVLYTYKSARAQNTA